MSDSAASTSEFDAPSPPTDNKSIVRAWPSFEPENDLRRDFFAGEGAERYAGRHLILDLWETTGLDDLESMEAVLRQAVAASEATLLHLHLHHFTPNNGISGVAVLAESHISVHTWPERDYAAFDLFMCGNAKPEAAAEVITRAFRPGRQELKTLVRGRFDTENA